MNFIQKAMTLGKSPREACEALLKQVGYYAFNRWAAKQGLNINFVLAVHRAVAMQKKLDTGNFA